VDTVKTKWELTGLDGAPWTPASDSVSPIAVSEVRTGREGQSGSLNRGAEGPDRPAEAAAQPPSEGKGGLKQ
jgi:hypothetical protein